MVFGRAPSPHLSQKFGRLRHGPKTGLSAELLMGYLNRYSRATLVRELCLVLVAMIWWVPFYVLLTVMLKPGSQATKAPFSPPAELELSNFSKAWQGTGGVGLGAAALNSMIITAGSVLVLLALGSISGYVIAR